MNIEKNLERWVGANLISQSQADQILNFEKESPSAGWALWGMSGIGIIVLMTGVISIIAANWYEISPLTKLAAYFIFLFLVAAGAFKFGKKEGLIKESLITIFALSILAGIGLIGQIFHLESDGYQGLFFWVLAILPITLCAKNRLINFLWFCGFSTAVLIWVAAAPNSEHIPQRFFLAAAIPYVFIGIGYILDGILSSYFCRTARTINYLFLLFGFTIAGNIIWANNIGSEFQHEEIGSWPWITLGGMLLGFTLSIFRKIQPSAASSLAIFVTFVGAACSFILPIIAVVGDHPLIGCLFFLLTWCGAAAIAALANRKRLYDIAALIIAIRFIVVYFEVFGTLAATGIGLMLSGATILGIAFLWYKYRATLAHFIQGAANA